MKRLASWILAGGLLAGTAAFAATPDLVISSISLSATTAYPGDKINIDSVTKNIGGDTGWWTWCDVYYYFGPASNKYANNFATGWTPNANEINGISADEEEEDSTSFTIPAGTLPGTYYITCVADGGHAVTESNEGNNAKSVAITVKGIPVISNVGWQEPRYVNDGDTAVMIGQCQYIPVGATLSITLYEDDSPFGDDLVTNLTTRVAYSAEQGYYFACRWKASCIDGDQSGDPEYYFTVSYTYAGGTVSCTSGKNAGEELHVTDARMTPSYSDGVNDFYYDPSGVSAGDATRKTALTDDRIPIILIHGQSGDAKPCTLNYWYGWVNSDTNYPLGYFNQSPMASRFRVYRYVYDSQDYISTNGVRLANFVNNWYATHPEFADRQVVLMAHSMGGLVSRYAMNVNTAFAARVHRLVTLGSPHLGAQGANPTWIKYSGPDDNSWFVSSIYNTFGLHNNTAGCFDLAWYATNEIPPAALTESAIQAMGDSYNLELMRKSLKNPFCGWAPMRSSAADSKCVLFGGSSTNKVTGMRADWRDDAASEVSTDHLGLWVATKIYRSMSYANGTGVGDNDGLVPLISALMSDDNTHLGADKINLNNLDGQQVDHASYLDVAVTMDDVRTRLMTMVRGYCQPAAAVDAGARWRLLDGVNTNAPWQKPGVMLPALTPGKTYTVEFKAIPGWTTPATRTVTAKSAVVMATTGTYVEEAPAATNAAPTAIRLSAAEVEENAPAGTLVGTLSATDADVGDTHTFALVSGAGDDDNALFSISGTSLRTAAAFDYEEAATRYIRVRATDSQGAYVEETFAVSILDLPDDLPGTVTGDSWATLRWDAVPGATAYRIDVSACEGVDRHAVPAAPLGTNSFLAGQEWRYATPGIPTAPYGAVAKAPCYFVYTSGTPHVSAHFLIGTNGVALQSKPFDVRGASSVAVAFTHGAWNTGGVIERARVETRYRLDGGVPASIPAGATADADGWILLASSLPSGSADGSNVAEEFVVQNPSAETIEFRISSPNALTLTNSSGHSFLRGAYVLDAAAERRGIGDYSSACRVTGYPVTVTDTVHTVSGLPADASYFYNVEALVGSTWTPCAEGRADTTDVVAPPADVAAADLAADALTVVWSASADAASYEVQLTSTLAAGPMETLVEIPSKNLSDATLNPTGWTYAQGHVPTTANWLCAQESATSDYHGLTVGALPGIQSPALDLSAYQDAQLVFTMRVRGSLSVAEAQACCSVDGGSTWIAGATASTNSIPINNNNFCVIPLPAAALVDGARVELCALHTSATNTSIWRGNGCGIRNLSLQARRKASPAYGAVEAAANGLSHAFDGLSPETTYYFRVRAIDANGHASAWVEASATTPAARVNTAPYGLALSGAPIPENAAVGTLVGTLSAFDDDAGDAMTFALVDGLGDSDNACFAIDGAALRSAVAFDYEMATSRTVRVRATDSAGAFCEESFAIAITDVEEPHVYADFSDPDFVSAVSNGTPDFISVVPAVASADDNTCFDLAWESVAAPAYDLYASTNLAEGFFFLRRVYTNAWTDPDVESDVKFWFVVPVDAP